MASAVGRLEPDVAPELEMVEEQVDVEIVFADLEVHLTPDECEALP